MGFFFVLLTKIKIVKEIGQLERVAFEFESAAGAFRIIQD